MQMQLIGPLARGSTPVHFGLSHFVWWLALRRHSTLVQARWWPGPLFPAQHHGISVANAIRRPCPAFSSRAHKPQRGVPWICRGRSKPMKRWTAFMSAGCVISTSDTMFQMIIMKDTEPVSIQVSHVVRRSNLWFEVYMFTIFSCHSHPRGGVIKQTNTCNSHVEVYRAA